MVPAYRPRPSALHSARPGLGAGFCAAFAVVAVLYDHPLVLTAAAAGVVGAGVAAGVGREVGRSARLGLPLALLIALVNPLVYQGGDTLLVRGGQFLGRSWDVTLEALAAGGVAGVRVLVLVLAFGLLSAAVDPDELLRLFRRVSYRSALTASLATRLVPVLARDATRMGDAARCRPQAPGRAAVARAALAGALDRAVDVAAALEVRGYSRAGRAPRRPVTWSRHDVRVAAAALLLVVVAVGGKLAGAGGLEAYPSLSVALGGPELAVTAAVLLCAALPFAGARSRLGVAAGGAQPDARPERSPIVDRASTEPGNLRQAPHRGVTRA
jgi:energy-coupling factor transport system permease protein